MSTDHGVPTNHISPSCGAVQLQDEAVHSSFEEAVGFEPTGPAHHRPVCFQNRCLKPDSATLPLLWLLYQTVCSFHSNGFCFIYNRH